MESIARIFGSLDDATRLRIMALLLEAQELCVCELMEVLQLPQSTVSRHLALLKDAGWLAGRREGVWNYYSVHQALPHIHQTLVPVIRHFLRDHTVAQTDRGRLQSLRYGSTCITHSQNRIQEP